MLVKTAILAPIMYFIVLLQSSFMPYFSFFGVTPNLIFILVIFLVFFAPSWSFISAFWGGIFLDYFSTHFLGFYVLILLGAVFFIKLVLKRYVQTPFK
ncbi:MAG: hypothetical protein Q7S03_00115 [bacterium]|nr:hypothetical protein [bacterium]